MTRREQLGLGQCGIWEKLLEVPDRDWLDVVAAHAGEPEDWTTWARRGGFPFPAVHLPTPEERAIWFAGYVQTYLERDLQVLSSIAALPDFRRLMRAACLRLGSPVNQSDLGRDIGLPQPTVHRYLNLLETSYVLVRVPAYSVHRTKRLLKSPRLYWSDTGLAMHLSQEEEPRGAHLENLVLQDLLVWRDSRSAQAEILHWRTTTNDEVDFVIEAGGALVPVEVRATRRPRLRDAAHLRTFRKEYGRAARSGLLLHGGDSLEWITPGVLAAPWWMVIRGRLARDGRHCRHTGRRFILTVRTILPDPRGLCLGREMSTPNRATPVLPVRRPPAMKLLLLACTLTAVSCRDDPGSGATSEAGTPSLPEKPSGVTGTDERVGTLEIRRPAEEPVGPAGEADEREDQVLNGDDDIPGSQDRFQRWSLSEEPSVVIGGADEREGYLLHQVTAATRLGDGRIVIANGGSLELRYYDPEGRHLLSAGGEGEGPGELMPPLDHFTRLPGDSILAASWQSGFIRFAPDGRYASSIPYELPPRGRCWQFVGNDLLPDGSLLLRFTGTSRFTDTDEPCPKLGEGRPPTVIGRYVPRSFGGIDTIAVLPGFDWSGDPYRMHAYAKNLVLAMAHDRLYLGDTGSDSILVMSFQGDTVS